MSEYSYSPQHEEAQINQNEAIAQPEVPENRELIEGMISDGAIIERRKWLEDRIGGEHDSAHGHAKRLIDASDRTSDSAYKAWESGDIAEHDRLKRHSIATRETAERMFGAKAVSEVAKCVQALFELDKTDNSRVRYWGEAAESIFDAVKTDSAIAEDRVDITKDRAINPVDSNGSREDFKRYLEGKRFIDYDRIKHSLASERHLQLWPDQDKPFEIPVTNIVSAGSIESWAGRDRGEGDKTYTKSSGEHVTGRSLDAIIDYAKRESSLPPLDEVDAFVQPNGMIIYVSPSSNHRTAAAIARGDATVKIKGPVNLFVINKNFVEPAVEQAKEASKETDWSDVFELVKSLNVPTDPRERAVDFANLSATDLAIMTTLLHSRLAPNADPNPLDSRMHVSSPDGMNKTELLDPDKRFALYQETEKLIKSLATDLRPETAEAFLERVSNIIALTTVITHTFNDGNGRTGRFMAHLVREGYQDEPELIEDLKVVGSNRTGKGFRIYSYVPRMGSMTPAEYLETVAATNIPLDDKDQYKKAVEGLFTSPYGDF